jgi:catalase
MRPGSNFTDIIGRKVMKNKKKHGDRRDEHEQSKIEDLEEFYEDPPDTYLTTNQGVRISHTDDSLKAGQRGPTLMEDFHFREKLTHFDHERIPERIVHARGSGAHGYFQVYESMADVTKADFLQDPSIRTPVFVRFSTVVGFRGSADTVRDVRGFATKFYTRDGNYDLVGNNMPVFFIQDAIKFPDLVHAIKPEPHHEMPQASAAHDNFWDFVSLMPESMHMIMWVLSDRALPRSYAMMEGFGVHTFRFINEAGESRFVKFHWKPVLGVHSLVWDETQKIAGKDPDFNRRDLWNAIEMGNFPEYELGVQIVEEKDEFSFDFDLLDPTKIIPEELVPVRIIGKMVLDHNPDNFFAETEQVAFHPGHVVPGIDFTNDPLLQGRLFSYLDTQLIRLGGPNFAEIPINRPMAPVHNNQRDGFFRQTINKGTTNYFPNSMGAGFPMPAPENMRGYVHHAEKVDGHKIRERSESFRDFFSQARLFWNSQSEAEKMHLLSAFHFELGKVGSMEVRQRMVDMVSHIDEDLAVEVAKGIGIKGISEKRDEAARDAVMAKKGKGGVEKSAALSMENTRKDIIKGRRIAILAAEGVDTAGLLQVKKAIELEGAQVEVVGRFLGVISGPGDTEVKIDKSHVTTGSIMYDAVFVPGGTDGVEMMKQQGDTLHFVNESFKHCKAVAAYGEGIDLLEKAHLVDIHFSGMKENSDLTVDKGVVTSRKGSVPEFIQEFIKAIAMHRHWEREKIKDRIPA